MKYKVLSLLLLSTAWLSPACAQSEEIKTEIVESTFYDRFVKLGGTVIPYKKVTINAQQAGQVDYLSGVEGDKFSLGTLLVSTDDDVLLAQRGVAMAQWEQAYHVYNNAKAQYNRELWSPATDQVMPGMALPGLMDKMFTRPMSNTMGYGDHNIDRQANIINAVANINKAIAQMRMIKSNIAEIDVHLSNTNSFAPFEGIIVKKMVEKGDAVQPGQPLLVFAKTGQLSLEVNVPVSLMLGIEKGAIFQAQLSGKQLIEVRVSQVFPVADPRQHTVIVKLDLPVGIPAAPGMYGTVSVLNSSATGRSFPYVPISAVVKRGSLPSVFVVNETTKAVEMKIIRLGRALEGRYTVLSGIHNGQRIIVNPPSNIRSGWVLVNGKLTPPKND